MYRPVVYIKPHLQKLKLCNSRYVNCWIVVLFCLLHLLMGHQFSLCVNLMALYVFVLTIELLTLLLRKIGTHCQLRRN